MLNGYGKMSRCFFWRIKDSLPLSWISALVFRTFKRTYFERMNLLWWPMIRISFYRITLHFVNKRSWAISFGKKAFEKARVDQIINSPSKNRLHRQRDDKYLYQADNLTFKALFNFSNVLFTGSVSPSSFSLRVSSKREDHRRSSFAFWNF